MNLGEIKTIIRGALGRGTTLDSVMVSHIKMVVNEIEGRRFWQYMQQERTTTVAAGENVISLPENTTRNIDFLAQLTTNSDGSVSRATLPQVQPSQVTAIGTGEANGYYKLGANSLVLDNYLEEDTDFLLVGWFKSDVADDDNWTNWLTVNGPMVIIGLTLQKMAAYIRNSEVAQQYVQNLQMNDTAMTQMDDDLRFGGMVMEMQS